MVFVLTLLNIILIPTAVRSEELTSSSTGDPACPCLEAHTESMLRLHKRELNGKQCIVYVNRNTKVESCLELDYGLNKCTSWDDGSHGRVPECSDSQGYNPLWCSDSWCFVDEEQCTSSSTFEVEKDGGLPSAWFEGGKNVMVSYATCGTASYFSKLTAVPNNMTAEELREVSESHIASIIETFEREFKNHYRISGSTDDISEGNEQGYKCEFLDSCACETCGTVAGQWGDIIKVDLRNVTVTWNQKERGREQRFEEQTRCLGRHMENAYRSVAQQTYDDPNRVAYMYFGLHKNGAMVQWPASDWCPQAFDARLRPWYVTAVSGPKDVILTLDNSGSMAGTKWQLVIEAVGKVLDTLTEYDYVGLVLFNDITMIFEPDDMGPFLRPATKRLKQDMLSWLTHGERTPSPKGGTMYNIGFRDTFRFLTTSRNFNETTTSSCQTAILFVTDGGDTSAFQPQSLEEMQMELEVDGHSAPAMIFTYAFGINGTDDRDLLKEIACAHQGVYHEITPDMDGELLGGLMSTYYTTFAQAVEENNNTVARWIMYEDAGTGEELMGSCLPAYEDTGDDTRVLMGAGCMDINMLIRLSVLRERAAWPAFLEDVQTRSSQCASFHLTNPKLDLIREQHSNSLCPPKNHSETYRLLGYIASGLFGAICLCSLVLWFRKKIEAFQAHRPSRGSHNMPPAWQVRRRSSR